MTNFESYNGQWIPYLNLYQQAYLNWFKSNAFGGSNYSNTPVGGTSTVDEPNAIGGTYADVYLGLWSKGKCFALSAWMAVITDESVA